MFALCTITLYLSLRNISDEQLTLLKSGGEIFSFCSQERGQNVKNTSIVFLLTYADNRIETEMSKDRKTGNGLLTVEL